MERSVTKGGSTSPPFLYSTTTATTVNSVKELCFNYTINTTTESSKATTTTTTSTAATATATTTVNRSTSASNDISPLLTATDDDDNVSSSSSSPVAFLSSSSRSNSPASLFKLPSSSPSKLLSTCNVNNNNKENTSNNTANSSFSILLVNGDDDDDDDESKSPCLIYPVDTSTTTTAVSTTTLQCNSTTPTSKFILTSSEYSNVKVTSPTSTCPISSSWPQLPPQSQFPSATASPATSPRVTNSICTCLNNHHHHQKQQQQAQVKVDQKQQQHSIWTKFSQSNVQAVSKSNNFTQQKRKEKQNAQNVICTLDKITFGIAFTTKSGKRSITSLCLAIAVLFVTCFINETMQAKVDASTSSSSSSSSSSQPKSSSLSTFNSEYDACYNFTIGDRTKGEFYSPGYPNNYPNNTECIALITAPFGSYIKVEFRDMFSLEESDTCEYDRLEIRNGQYGYSDLLEVICGHNFPPEISSSDRYLWLRFKSDESIEYSGFRAVYHFIPLPTTRPEPPVCYFEKSGASGIVHHGEIPSEVFAYYKAYKTPIECIWNITVQFGWQMYINFNQYNLVKPNDCEVNYIDIYENVLSDEKRKARFCGTATEPQKSDGNIINIRFHAKEGLIENQEKDFRFEILFTAFRTNDREKCNDKTEFDCDDGTCIDISLKCNGDFNCKYRYDEDAATTCLKGGKGVMILTSEHMIIILIVFFALVIGMCASIIVSCWGKIQERRQRELEYKLRRSRETSMEGGLDRTMTVTSLDKNINLLPPLHSSATSVPPPPLGQVGPLLSSSRHSLHRSHPKLHHVSSSESAGLMLNGSPGMDEEQLDDEELDEDECDNDCYVPDVPDCCAVAAAAGELLDESVTGRRSHLGGGGRHSVTGVRGVSGGPSGPGGPGGSTFHPGHHHHHIHHSTRAQDEDDQYSSETPPTPPHQVISVNCPLYHQHQAHQSLHLSHHHLHHSQSSLHQAQQQSALGTPPTIHRHTPIGGSSSRLTGPGGGGSSSGLVVISNTREGSESPPIPPPPPPPAMSHLRGRVGVI